MKLSVIIPTYNRISSVERTFEYIAKSKTLPDEVIVVDQTLNSDLAGRIKRLCDSQKFNVNYLWRSEPSSTKARNVGMAYAKNDIIVFMDDDVDVTRDTFTNVKSLFSDNKVAMVAGYDGIPPCKNSNLGYLFNKSSYKKKHIGHVASGIYGRLPITAGHNNSPADVLTEWAMGFFFVVRKSLVQKWNLQFDEKLQYYAYAEDLDFSHLYYRCAKSEGLMCYYSLKCSVTHNVSKEYRTPKRALCFMSVVHREYIRYKHFGDSKYFYSSLWSNIGDVFARIVHREPVKDILDALHFLFKYRDDIRKGIFHYELFMND
ncbi:glycosyltransferase family 2 protein [Parabacteroides sp. ASD2025]|uniref:glycosyltransferase family 2 protein n=1 Tax=Parabacteroides sp. ASD2025 TaxID=3415987 RepID=UPI003CEDC8AD